MDITYAKKQFENYLDQYDRYDDKIQLKIIHTYGVVDCCRQITERMHLSQEDITLAELIGLLHDIGRFEQIKRFDSFEANTMDHAAFGVQLLFKKQQIHQFVKSRKWDSIIQTAIAHHSDFKLEGISDPHTLLHAKIIRDADKLDNCRVKLQDSIETILGVSAIEVGRSEITPTVMDQFKNQQSIFSPSRKTKMDYWLSYLAYFFDIYFQETLEIIQEKNYINRMIDRISYENPRTARQMETVRSDLQDYLKKRLS